MHSVELTRVKKIKSDIAGNNLSFVIPFLAVFCDFVLYLFWENERCVMDDTNYLKKNGQFF